MEDNPRLLKKMRQDVQKQLDQLSCEHALGHIPSIENLLANQNYALIHLEDHFRTDSNWAMTALSEVKHHISNWRKVWEDGRKLLANYPDELSEVGEHHPLYRLMHVNLGNDISELKLALSNAYKQAKKRYRSRSKYTHPKGADQ